MRALYGRLNLLQKIICIFCFIFIVIFGLCFTGFQLIMRNTYLREMRDYTESAAAGTAVAVDQYIESMNLTAYTTMYSNWAQNILRITYNLNDQETQTLSDNANHMLSNISQISGDIGIAIYGDNGAVASSAGTIGADYKYGYDLSKEDWYETLQTQKRYLQWGERSAYMLKRPKEESLSVYYTVRDYHSLEQNGHLILTIPKSRLAGIIADTPSEFSYLVRTTEGEIVYMGLSEEQQELTHQRLADLTPGTAVVLNNRAPYCVISMEQSALTGWEIYAVSYRKDMGVSILGEGLFLMGIIIPLGLLIMAIAIYLARYVTSPIIQCKNALLKIRDNQFGQTIENHYHDEIGELIAGFNDMSREIYDLIERNKSIEQLKNEAEFEMLQQKINPHFLYNTLEMIIGLILDSQDMQAVNVCESLGSMFRYNLEDKGRVDLRREYEYICQYLTIIYFKIPDLDFYSDVDEFLLDQPFHKFILQPLVENSIKHGFRYKQEECCLQVNIKHDPEASAICITIMDNGDGMSEESLIFTEQLFEDIRNGRTIDSGGHVGLGNVYQRLWLEYGPQMSFMIRSAQGSGTKIEITIPKGGVQ